MSNLRSIVRRVLLEAAPSNPQMQAATQQAKMTVGKEWISPYAKVDEGVFIEDSVIGYNAIVGLVKAMDSRPTPRVTARWEAPPR